MGWILNLDLSAKICFSTAAPEHFQYKYTINSKWCQHSLKDFLLAMFCTGCLHVEVATCRTGKSVVFTHFEGLPGNDQEILSDAYPWRLILINCDILVLTKMSKIDLCVN